MMKCKTRARFSAREKQSSGSGVMFPGAKRAGFHCRFYFDFWLTWLVRLRSVDAILGTYYNNR